MGFASHVCQAGSSVAGLQSPLLQSSNDCDPTPEHEESTALPQQEEPRIIVVEEAPTANRWSDRASMEEKVATLMEVAISLENRIRIVEDASLESQRSRRMGCCGQNDCL